MYEQGINLLNKSKQKLALAIAIGEGSQAIAKQSINQSNRNLPTRVTSSSPSDPLKWSAKNVNKQGNAVSISIAGGVATATQSFCQSNDTLIDVSHTLKTEAKRSEMNESIIIDIDQAAVKLKIQVDQEGKVYLNGAKASSFQFKKAFKD